MQPLNVDEPKWFIYVYIDPTTDEPFYIGKGRGTRDRAHLRAHLLKKKKLFYNKLRKMRRSDIVPEIRRLITGLTNAEAIQWERFFIKAVGRRLDVNNPGPLCNLTDGGEGISGKRHSDATKRRLRELRHRQIFTPEQRARHRAATIAANKGKRASTETRRRMSEAQTGRKPSPESVARAAAKRRGRKASMTTRGRMAASHLAYTCYLSPTLPIEPYELILSADESTIVRRDRGYQRKSRARDWFLKHAYRVPVFPLDTNSLFISLLAESS